MTKTDSDGAKTTYNVGPGMESLFAGCVFPFCLMLVVLVGAELITGIIQINN